MCAKTREKGHKEKHAAETRYRRRETPEGFGPKLKHGSRERPHPDTAIRKSARRNREISGNVNRLKKSLPQCQSHSTHQPPVLFPDKLPAYLFIKRKMVKEEENGTCIL